MGDIVAGNLPGRPFIPEGAEVREDIYALKKLKEDLNVKPIKEVSPRLFTVQKRRQN